jgi:hypothetical protein
MPLEAGMIGDEVWIAAARYQAKEHALRWALVRTFCS